METVKIDVLIIGDLAALSYISCHSQKSSVVALRNFQVDSNAIPDTIVTEDVTYDVREAIVFDTLAMKGQVNVNSLFVPKGKNVLATGILLSRAIRLSDTGTTVKTKSK